MKIVKSWAVPVLLLLSCPLMAQDEPAIVKLTVKHNGKIVPPPKQIILGVSGDFHIRMPLKDGIFEVPPEILKKHFKELDFSTVVDGDQIHTEMLGKDIDMPRWTLVLEDSRFPDDYAPIPKGAKARSSCIIEYDSDEGDGTYMFAQHCRSKISNGESK
jgi:hypothetical protein